MRWHLTLAHLWLTSACVVSESDPSSVSSTSNRRACLPNTLTAMYGSHRITKQFISSDSYGFTQDLASIIKSSDKIAGKDYIVVDVRDDDYVGGNIKNSHNLPSYVFSKNVDDLVRKTKDVPMVIFHCALSQERQVDQSCPSAIVQCSADHHQGPKSRSSTSSIKSQEDPRYSAMCVVLKDVRADTRTFRKVGRCDTP